MFLATTADSHKKIHVVNPLEINVLLFNTQTSAMPVKVKLEFTMKFINFNFGILFTIFCPYNFEINSVQ